MAKLMLLVIGYLMDSKEDYNNNWETFIQLLSLLFFFFFNFFSRLFLLYYSSLTWASEIFLVLD